ncbi:MAG: hypothetical protein WD939_02210 [Dehalococcoidia bacterium]
MPMASTPVEFANALAERRSNITKALDDLFKRPADLATHPHVGDLRKSKYLDQTIRQWIKDELIARGVTKPREFNHIDAWPKTQKENLRKAMLHAIDNNVKMRFFWELYGGNNEATTIEPSPLPSSGTITVTFLSPQSRVRVGQAASTFGQIFVDVGA